MTASERVREYMYSLAGENSAFCERIRAEAIAADIPVIKRDTEMLLKSILALKNPGSILELGTAVGYSAILMYESAAEDAIITTVEKYEPRLEEARKNFALSGAGRRIELIEGDVLQVMKKLLDEGRSYDFIFMDAAKGQYINWLETALSLLNRGGVLFSDNVLQNGDVAESRFAVDRRDRTIHARMREYLYAITHDKRLCTSIIPVGDGAALSVLKEK